MEKTKLISAAVTVSLSVLAASVFGTMGAHAAFPWGAISVTPNTGLTDGQIVQVSGGEFQKNRVLRIVECGPLQQHPPKGGVVYAICSNYSVEVTSDDNGSFPAQNFTVSTIIQGSRFERGHYVPATHDCLPANDCHIHVFAPVTGNGSANQDISFS